MKKTKVIITKFSHFLFYFQSINFQNLILENKPRVYKTIERKYSISSIERMASLIRNHSSATPKRRNNLLGKKNAYFDALKYEEINNPNLVLISKSNVFDSMNPAQKSDIISPFDKLASIKLKQDCFRRGQTAFVKKRMSHYGE